MANSAAWSGDGEYVVVSTTESGDDGRPKMTGAINGGFYQKTDDLNTSIRR